MGTTLFGDCNPDLYYYGPDPYVLMAATLPDEMYYVSIDDSTLWKGPSYTEPYIPPKSTTPPPKDTSTPMKTPTLKTTPSKPWIITDNAVLAKNEEMIKTLAPEMQPYARALLAAANDAGYALFITWARRTNQQEQDCINKGYGGLINGSHTYGWAFDVQFWHSEYVGVWPCDPMAFLDAQRNDILINGVKIYGVYGKYIVNGMDQYAQIGQIGTALGLAWGGNIIDGIPKGNDIVHFQIKDFYKTRKYYYGF